jgi:hypothetical protein
VRSECKPVDAAAVFYDNNTARLLRGGEPMSNHDGGALVRDAIERRQPQSFALGVERGSRLTKQQRRCTIARNSEALA